VSKEGDSKGLLDLCLECGLCCNGTIFADVRLQPGDDVARFQRLGLALSRKVSPGRETVGMTDAEKARRSSGWSFSQPCTAYDGCQCRIYRERPTYCREFECLLLKAVGAGRLKAPAALAVVRNAKALVENVRSLLRSLGDTEETAALATRFRRTARRLQQVGAGKAESATYSELTLAFHELNLLLSESFFR
jgi:Fe-S-cluster containining protein